MKREVVVVTLWDGPVVLRFSTMPDQAELDKIATAYTARNCGVRPTARVVEEVAIGAFSRGNGEATCEDLQ